MSELKAVKAFLQMFVADTDPPGLIVPSDFDANDFTNAWADASAELRTKARRKLFNDQS